jgi:hypothetical protein
MLLATLTMSVTCVVAKEAPPILQTDTESVTVCCNDQLPSFVLPEYNFEAYKVDAIVVCPITPEYHYSIFECDFSLLNLRYSDKKSLPYSLYRAESMEQYIIYNQRKIFPKRSYSNIYPGFSRQVKKG